MMSSEHLRPFAAFVLVSLVCAMVMVRSLQDATVEALRPGGFAVAERTHQVTTDTPSRALVAAPGRADLRSARATTRSGATPSADGARQSRPADHGSSRPTSTRPTQTSSTPPSTTPTGTTGPSTPPATGSPKPGPTDPGVAKRVARLKDRLANLRMRVAESSGPLRKNLQRKVRQVIAEIQDLKDGSGDGTQSGPDSPESSDPAPSDPTQGLAGIVGLTDLAPSADADAAPAPEATEAETTQSEVVTQP